MLQDAFPIIQNSGDEPVSKVEWEDLPSRVKDCRHEGIFHLLDKPIVERLCVLPSIAGFP